MSTDTALQPPRPALPIEQRSSGMGAGYARVAVAGTGPSLRLPAAAQLLSAKALKSLGVSATPKRRLLFAVAACLFAAIVPTDIAFGLEMWVSRRIAGIPQHYILTTLAILFAVVNDSTYLKQLLRRPAVAVFLSCLLMTIVVGIFRNGYNPFIVRADLYLIRWFFVGFLLMRLAIISGSLREYLIVAAITILVTTFRISDRNTMGGQLDPTLARAASSDFWPVINLGCVMLGMLVTVTWPRSMAHVVFCSTAFALLVLAGGIRTSTRSLFIQQVLCFVLCLLALSRDPRMHGRGRELRRAFVIVVLAAAALAALLVATGKFMTDATQLGARFTAEVSERYDTGLYRLREAADMLESMTAEVWIFGVGVGGMWFDTRNNEWSGVPHIAVLGWLLKGGLAIFALVVWAFYARPFFAFAKAVVAPRKRPEIPTPILIVGPPILAWCALTFLSGGIDIGSFFGLGGLAALGMQLADDNRRVLRPR